MSRDPQRLPDYLGHILEAIVRIQSPLNPVLPPIKISHTAAGGAQQGHADARRRSPLIGIHRQHIALAVELFGGGG